MDVEKMADVMNQMLQSEELKQMQVTAAVDDGIRAACFVNKSTGEATVAFRGTGGTYDQWYDNLEGYGELSTEAQRDAAEFINGLSYDNLTVTGHSKGGNLAMYVTIVCADKIDKCLSYEGQGFSNEFHNAYADEINEAKQKGKITSISASNDPVHGLLIPIAAVERFVHSDSWPFSHGAYSILTSKKNSFDETGNFSQDSYCKEMELIKNFGQATEIASGVSNIWLIGSAIEYVADIVGVGAGLFFEDDEEKWTYAWRSVKKAWLDFNKSLVNDVAEIVDSFIETVERFKEEATRLTYGYKYAIANAQIVVDTYKLDSYAQRLRAVNTRINNLDKRLDSLYGRVGLLDLWNLIQADVLTGQSLRLSRCASYLSDTASDFNSVENDLVNKLQ